jgi:hypothetical protein
VKTTITTKARSPVGTLLALTLVASLLVFAGLYLVTDGGMLTRFKVMLADYSRAQSILTTLQDNLKKYDRPQLITLYALAIVAGAAGVSIVGSFIRTNQYRFVAARKEVEKRGLWMYVPLCVLAWAMLTGILMLCDKWAVTGPVRWLLGPAFFDRFGGYVVPVLWIALSGGIAYAVIWALWRRLERWLGRSLFVPGWRRRVPFSKIKRMEIQNSGEGATVLVLVLANGSAWTIQSGRVKRLQRVGAVLSRRLGLERRDFVTWA